jgi:hypothetical protein
MFSEVPEQVAQVRVTRLQDARGFIAHTLLKILHGEGQRALFFRVLAVDVAANSLQLRMERFTLFWQQQDVELVRPCQRVIIW